MSLTFFRGQVGFMQDHGFEVHAMSSPGPGLVSFSNSEGIPVHAIDMPRRITPLRDLAALVRIWVRLVRIRPCIVHAHTPKAGLLVTIAAWLARRPVRIYHIHGLPLLTARGVRRALLHASEVMACRLSTKVLCVSASLQEVAVAERLCPPGKIAVLAAGTINGVDATGRFTPDRISPELRLQTRQVHGIPDDAVVVGYVGRLVQDKGIVDLAHAWELIRGSHPKLHLLLVGPEEAQDPVPSQVLSALRQDPRVHFTGLNWDTPPLYAAMDMLVLPTYREGFPTAPLEASAMELPVIATDVPGCIDAVVDGKTGTLVPPRNPTALGRAIARYIIDPELRQKHGRAGRSRVLTDFKREVVWEALLSEYRRLLGAVAASSAVDRRVHVDAADTERHVIC